MVKEKPGVARDANAPERTSVRSPHVCLETLEERLEAGVPLLHAGPRSAGGFPFSGEAPVEACPCQGVLCLCDGHDCMGVCDLHCLVNYA